MTASVKEEFKPIKIQYRDTRCGRAAFRFRMLLDLQAKTVYDFLKKHLPAVRGSLLDVGCGEAPYRHLLAPAVSYTGLDVPEAESFGMAASSDIVSFDGRTIPFGDNSFDSILCTEVLEHAEGPEKLVEEMHRVLKPGGVLFATIPFSARVHHAPYDFHRFTNWRLKTLFGQFRHVEISERGNDVCAIASKLVVIGMRLARPTLDTSALWRVPLLIVLSPFIVAALLAAHGSLCWGYGSAADPLGYAIVATK